MAWSSSLNNKFAKIQPKKEEKKQNSSFYDDFQSRRSENSGGLASTPSVKSTSSNTSSSKKTSSSSKQSGSSSGSKKTAPTTTFGNSTKFFKGYQTYQERKKSGNVFTPSTVMGKISNGFDLNTTLGLKAANDKKKQEQQKFDSGVYHPNTQLTSGDNAIAEKKPGFGKWLVDNLMNGIGQFNRGLASTVDFILPTAGDFGGDSVVDRVIDYYRGDSDALAQKAAETNTVKGGHWDTAGNLVSGTVAAIPNAVIAMMSGGMATGAAALESTASTGIGQTMISSAQQLMKNPMFWTSFAQTAGNSYDEAKADGASDLEATATAMISSFINAGVEIGSGIETIPNNPRSISTWVKGMLDEGKEEVVQGIVEQATKKAIYDQNKKLISPTDENAVINPNRAGDEFIGGAVVGGVLGAGQMGAGAAIDAYNDTVQTGQAINNAGAAQDMVDIGLKRDANTSANKYAQKMQQKQSKGADLSDWNVGRQYQKNVKAIDAENKFINDIANVTGTETQVHADMGGVNGQFTSDNGQQRVDISANGDTSIPATVKHEFTHLFKQNAGEAYQAFEDYMYKSAMETNPQAVQDRLASLKKLYEKNGLQYTDEIGKEEIVAEMTDTFEPNVNKIAYGNPNLADKVLNGIRTAKAHLQSALSSPYTNNRTGVQMTYAQLNNAEQLWNNALRQAAENKGNVDSNSVVKNSAKESADITNHKEKQLEIILNRNPALNEYSTWVRNIDDIKTFEETLLDDDWEDGEDFDPDYTWDMAQEAVKTGDITVYSSHPIEQGIFVTPSRMEAESYSGNGNIYEKNVRLSDIAWIDPTQGQYAKIDDKIVKNSVKENTSDAQTKSDNFKQWFGDWENDPENASKVVNEDGTPKIVYHGTNSDFTTFDTQRFNTRENSGDYVGEGFFFADKESTAKKYGSNVMPVYLNLRNPLIINTEQDGENFRSTFLNMYQKGDKELRDLIGGDYDYFSIMEENPSAIRQELQRRGYDGLIDNLYGQYAVFNPNQIKSATDNVGTFDRNNDDIRYSVKEDTETASVTDSMAADIIKSNNSTLKKSDISGEIEEIYSILTNGNVTDEKFQNAWSMAENVGRRIAETSQITDVDTSDEYKRLLNWVRNTPVSISDTDKADIGGVDSFNEFRKKNFGSIRLTNSGTPIDIAYQELSQQFPQYFDAQNETHPADQLTRIQDILQDLKPTMRTLSDEERSGVADDVAVKLITDIMNNNDIQLSDSNFFDDMPNGKKLSQLFTNTMQKGAYTGEFKSEAERRKTEFMYEGITNKETYEAAQADISNRGDDTVLAELSMKDGGWSAEDTAKSLALMAKYQSENNTSKAVDVASMLREKMTQAGQAIQALKIVNKLTPEGQFLDFVRQAEKMVDEQIEKHPAKDKIRKELNAAKKKDQARQKKTKETDREHFIPREAEVDTSVPEIDEKYKYGEQETLIPKEPIADDNTEPSIGTPVNGEQETLIPKSYYDEVLDKWKIDHLSAEDMQQVNDTLKTLDTLDDKNDLINLILKQSKERKTASHALVKKALEGQNIEFLKDTALMQVFGKISDKMPSSLAQKASTYQAMSHLLNARTMMRNITSNTAFNTVDRISTDIGSIVDSLIGVFSGKRTVGVDRGVFEKGRFRASADRAAQQYLDIALAVNHETDSSKYNLNSARRTFKGRTIGGLERGMSYGLQVTDEWSKGGIEYNIKKSLERLKKSGFTAEEIDNIAKFEAKYRTFQDDTKLGQILKGLKDTLNVIGVGETKQLGRLKSHEFGLGDLVQKYTQVPGALITRSVEYSPLGYCKALYNIGKAVYNKSKGADFSAADQRNIALSLGRAMTGTGLIALFAGLSGLGIFTGEREDKDEKLKAMENAEGISNTQLNLSALSRLISSGGKDAGGRQNGDVLTSLGFLEPLSTLMAMGNAVAEKGSVKNPVDWASAATAKTFDQIMDMSTMSTMRSISNTLTYGGNGWDVAVGTLTDSATGFIPGPVRQLGSFLDTTQRNPYNEENSTDKARERFKASLPWVREDVAAKINPYGEEKTTSSGNRAIDFLNNFFSPGYVNIYQTGNISEELYRLSEQSTDVLPHVPAKKFDVDGVTYKPRGKEYEKYSRLVGTITAQKMRDIINADNYEDMSDADKVEALSKAAKDGEKEAKQQYATGEFATVSSGTFRMTEPSTVTAKQQEMQAKQEQQQRAVSQLQTVANNLAAAVPDKADEYSVNSLQINDIKSAKIDGKSYDISGETESKVIAAANEEHYSNIEKLMNNEINVEDVVGYTSKGKARTSKQADGTKVSLTGKMYNDDGTPRFDELVTAKIIYQSKEAAKKHAAEKYRDEITGAASQPTATDEPVKVSQNTGGRARFTSARASGGSSSGRRKSGGTSTGSRSSSGGSSRVQFTARANTGNTSGTASIGTRSAVSLPNTVNPRLIQAAVDSFMKNKNVSNAVKPLENPLFM